MNAVFAVYENELEELRLHAAQAANDLAQTTNALNMLEGARAGQQATVTRLQQRIANLEERYECEKADWQAMQEDQQEP